MWNKVKSGSEIRIKRISLTLRIQEWRNKLKVCDRIGYGMFIFHKSTLTGIEFWLGVLRKCIENINKYVIVACLKRVGKLSFACPDFPHCILTIVKGVLNLLYYLEVWKAICYTVFRCFIPSKSSVSEG
jgi:hypothetical protein